MLLHATKVATGRGASYAVRRAAARTWIRTYAKDERPHRAPPKQASRPDTLEPTYEPKGPVENRTWSPARGIAFTSSPQPDASPEQLEVNAAQSIKQKSTSDASYGAPPTAPSTEPIATPPPAASNTESIVTPPPATGTAAPHSIDSTASAQEAEPTPTGPLPDLRQGLPSTFDAEFLKKPSAPQISSDLNVTENPADEPPRGNGEIPNKGAYVSSIDRRRNLFARVAAIGFGAFTVVGVLYLGQDWQDEFEARLNPEVPNGWNPTAMYGRIRARLSHSLGYYTEPAFPKLLPDVDPMMKPPYTLVLSLEDLLVTSKWSRTKGWEVAKRPGVDYFLRYLSQYYELVIFTSVQMMNADLIIRKLDPYHIVMWPLFREATRYMNGAHVKDLSYLNRPLSKTLIIDTDHEHTQLQPENAITLPKWKGESGDTHATDLVALVPFLEYIANMSVEDVRKVLASYEGKHIPTEFAAREARAREAFNRTLAEEKAKRPRIGSGLGGFASALGFKAQPSMMQVPGEPTAAEALAQGKMLSDQMRERGRRNYEQIEKEIRENGAKWLEEMAREEKKAQEEQMKSVQGGVSGFLGGLVGGGGGSA